MSRTELIAALKAQTLLTPRPGRDGEQGPQGEPGRDGATGAKGEAGPKGDSGRNGDPGPKGEVGEPGPKGDLGRGIEEVEAVSLPPGAAPKAIWGRTTGHLVLGIPEGQPGAPGAAGRSFVGGGGGGGVSSAAVDAAIAAALADLDVQLNAWTGSAWIPVLVTTEGKLQVTS